MTSTQQNGPKSMTAGGGWTSISSCLVQGEKEDLMRGRARRATYHRNSTYSLEVVSGLPRWVSGTLFSHHMADIIAIDHNRRDGHAGFLADFNCIQRFDECRNSTFGERLKGLDYKLSSAGIGTQVRFEIEPRRCRMTTPCGSCPIFGAPPKPASPLPSCDHWNKIFAIIPLSSCFSR